ncbi:ROK family transcriptional regulator [Microbacterium sp. STN6]|uniref:ROK family transcriptional regulator n=1 Tax=Microbacterium sp. STN6 TaxID=2995588 RepID=UPI002260AB4A|nr:ROK family transcriptional regulator [Microbacterium sp. STN6]MCX7522632.1 ROK family transcriptional regulator [Microbacterium sp. STN6]
MADQRRTPGSQTSLREANRARIVDAIKKHGGLTQVELAGVTGLSAATVSNIVKELTASGVLHTAPSTRSGRRAQYVTLAHALGLVAGVHYSTRHMRVVLADVAHTVLAEHHLPLAKDHRADNELDRATLLIADMLESVDSELDELLAVGIALPAPLKTATGTTARGGILRGWDAVPVADVMERRLKRPTFVDNSGNLSLLAEARLGAARGKSNVVFIDVGDGIGSGLLLAGAMFRGHNGVAGEFGHITIRENGPLCRCGNRGCLEAIAGGPAVLEALKPEQGPLKLGDVVIRAMAGEAPFVRAIAEAGKHIGVAAANVCNLLDPERLVVGGELARAGELLLGPLRHAVERSIIVDEESMPDVVQGQLGNRAAALGAMILAIDSVEISTEDAAIA